MCRRTYGDEEAWFLINMSPKHLTGKLKMEGFHEASDLVKGPLKPKLGKLKVKVDPFSIRCLVLER